MPFYLRVILKRYSYVNRGLGLKTQIECEKSINEKGEIYSEYP